MRHSHCESRAFFGIGGGTKLVEQYERASIGEARETVKIGDVRGEGGKCRLDRLGIANVGQECGEYGKAGARGGHGNSSLRHHGEQRGGLQSHRFAASIGPADDELTLVRRQLQNERNSLSSARPQALFEQRVARALEEQPLGIECGRNTIEFASKAGARQKAIDQSQHTRALDQT